MRTKTNSRSTENVDIAQEGIWSTLRKESILYKVTNSLREFPFYLHKNEAARRSHVSLLKI
jgi:hypothetical protein